MTGQKISLHHCSLFHCFSGLARPEAAEMKWGLLREMLQKDARIWENTFEASQKQLHHTGVDGTTFLLSSIYLGMGVYSIGFVFTNRPRHVWPVIFTKMTGHMNIIGPWNRANPGNCSTLRLRYKSSRGIHKDDKKACILRTSPLPYYSAREGLPDFWSWKVALQWPSNVPQT